jgi:hypothetical protein
MARVVTYATDESNYEEFRQTVLNQTGYLMYVGPDFRLYSVANDSSAAAIDAAMPGYTLYQAEEGSTLPGEIAVFTAELDGDAPPVSGAESQGGGVSTTDDVPDEEDKQESGVGGKSDESVSILKGAEMSWFFDPDSGKWYVMYGLPNSTMAAVYEATGSQLDAIFGEGQRPANYEEMSFSEITQMEGVVFAGDVSEVHGTGSYEDEVSRVTALGLDEGTLPPWAAGDPAVMDIIYLAEAEDKSDEWVLNQIAKLPSFEARFPGIAHLQSAGNLTLGEAVEGFLEFEAGVQNIQKRYGFEAAVSPDIVSDLLADGQSLSDVEFVYQSFDTLNKNAGAFAAFNAVLQARGMAPLTTEDQLKFLAGNAPAEMYDIWEETSFARAAEEAGIGLSVEEAMDLARRTDGHSTYDQAAHWLQVAAKNLLAFREDIALDRYDIDQQDLIDVSLGLAPSSGRSQAEVGRNVNRALQASRAFTEGPRAHMFRRFTDRGVPQAVSGDTARTKR